MEGWVRRVRREKVVWEELLVRFEEGLGAWVSGWVREGRE